MTDTGVKCLFVSVRGSLGDLSQPNFVASTQALLFLLCTNFDPEQSSHTKKTHERLNRVCVWCVCVCVSVHGYGCGCVVGVWFGYVSTAQWVSALHIILIHNTIDVHVDKLGVYNRHDTCWLWTIFCIHVVEAPVSINASYSNVCCNTIVVIITHCIPLHRMVHRMTNQTFPMVSQWIIRGILPRV